MAVTKMVDLESQKKAPLWTGLEASGAAYTALTVVRAVV
jgi:hypothetical protein